MRKVSELGEPSPWYERYQNWAILPSVVRKVSEFGGPSRWYQNATSSLSLYKRYQNPAADADDIVSRLIVIPNHSEHPRWSDNAVGMSVETEWGNSSPMPWWY